MDGVGEKAVASYLASEFKPKTVAVIDDATAYGEGLANEVEKALKAVPGLGAAEVNLATETANVSLAAGAAPELLARFSVDGKPPRTVLIVHVERVYFQCARALLRSRLWDPAQHVERASLPSVGKILEDLTRSRIDSARTAMLVIGVSSTRPASDTRSESRFSARAIAASP